MIEIKDVTKTFQSLTAVNRVSLEIPEGEVFGLLGTNGAGKSTLLRMLAGILKQDSGSIYIDGQTAWDNANVKKMCFYLSDKQYFFQTASSEAMGLFYKNLYPSFCNERYLHLLEEFGFDRFQKLRTFSNGMKKQVAILAALCADVPYLFCDEMFDGLDPVIRHSITSLLRNEMKRRRLDMISNCFLGYCFFGYCMFIPKESAPPLTYVAVAYHISENITIYRKYPITSIEEIDAFEIIYRSSAYKKSAFPAINHKSTGTRHYVWSNGIQKHHLDLTTEENEKLLTLITTDITNLTIDTIKKEFPIGTLSLVYGTSDYGEEVPLYPSFTDTINYLETLGIPARQTIADYKVTHIQIYEKQEKTASLGETTSSWQLILDTTDEKTIQSLTGQLIPEEYATNPLLHPINQDKFIARVSSSEKCSIWLQNWCNFYFVSKF